MLSRITFTSPAGISRRIAASTRSVSRAVSSMRVPVLARRCKMNCPLSVSGKKFSPSWGASRKAERQTAKNIGMKTRRRPTSVVSSRRYATRTRSNPRSNACCPRASKFRDGAAPSTGGARAPAGGHDLEGLPEQADDDDRRQDGERDGHRDDGRGPPAAEEEQDHRGGQAGGVHRLANHTADRRPDEDRLVGQRLDAELR